MRYMATNDEKMSRKPLLSTLQLAHTRKLREQGESPGDIAPSLNVSRQTLYRALRAYDFTI